MGLSHLLSEKAFDSAPYSETNTPPRAPVLSPQWVFRLRFTFPKKYAIISTKAR